MADAQDTLYQYLLTEDFWNGQLSDGLTVVKPFLHKPSTVMPG